MATDETDGEDGSEEIADDSASRQKTDQKQSKEGKENAKGGVVCSLSIPTIISALHQKAIEETKASSQGAKIVNSAIADSDKSADGSGKPQLTSAGEHIISVLPDGKTEGAKIDKAVAIALLKTYVQWFVGPDLTKKVDDKTVKSLTEDPLKESRIIMSFRDFLNETTEEEETSDETVEDDETSEGGEEDETSDEGSEDDETSEGGEEDETSDENNKDGENANDKDENVEDPNSSKLGYYIAYNLVVEGLKQTALKDAVKKFASTFFDDVTIKASGIFGGSGSFTVKDIKDKFKDAFGAIDPKDLVDKVQTQLEIMFPSTSHTNVYIRDKDTLLSDYGKQMSGQQRKKIDTAKYSLFIKTEDDNDPKIKILSPTKVANIVTSSIKGLFKKFKNKVSKDDVIYLPSFKDTHNDTKKIQELEGKVPTSGEIKTIIDKNDATKVVSMIDKKMNQLQRDRNIFNNSKKAKKAYSLWYNFKELKEKNKEDTKGIAKGKDTWNYFKQFFDAYEKEIGIHGGDDQFNKTSESINSLKNFSNQSYVKKFVVESILLNCFNLNEADEKTEKTEQQKEVEEVDPQTIVINNERLQQISRIVGKHLSANGFKPFKCIAGDKSTINKEADLYDKSKINKILEDTKYAIFVDYVKPDDSDDKKDKDKEKQLKETDSIKTEILDILFESYEHKIAILEAKKKNAKTDKDAGTTEDIKIPTLEQIQEIIDNNIASLEINNVHYHALSYQGKTSAYLITFTPEMESSGVSVASSDDLSNTVTDDSDDSESGKHDVYIIPMPGLKYQDKEYDTYA